MCIMRNAWGVDGGGVVETSRNSGEASKEASRRAAKQNAEDKVETQKKLTRSNVGALLPR